MDASARRIGVGQARALITAALGRPPVDELEAAVVLESMLGVRSELAVPLGGDVMRTNAPSDRAPYAPRPITGAHPPPRLAGAVLPLVQLTWAMVVAHPVGADDEWRWVLPVSMALQSLCAARSARATGSVDRLRADLCSLPGAAATLTALAVLVAVGLAWPLAALLFVAWTAGGVTAEVGRPLPVLALLGAGLLAAGAGASPAGVLVGTAGALVALLAISLADGDAGSAPAARWSPAILRACTALGVGIALATGLGPSAVDTTVVAVPAVLVVGLGTWLLERVWRELSRAMATTALSARRSRPGGQVVTSTVRTLVALTAFVASGAAAVTVWAGRGAGSWWQGPVGTFYGLAVTTVTATAGFCSLSVAAFAALTGGAAALTLAFAGTSHGIGLAVASAVIVVCCAGSLQRFAHRPDAALAARLWI